MATHYERAAYRLITSIRRAEAGEHSVPVSDLITAFASEWGLTGPEVVLLKQEAITEVARLREARSR